MVESYQPPSVIFIGVIGKGWYGKFGMVRRNEFRLHPSHSCGAGPSRSPDEKNGLKVAFDYEAVSYIVASVTIYRSGCFQASICPLADLRLQGVRQELRREAGLLKGDRGPR